MPAKLPPSRIKPPFPVLTIRDMPIGSEHYADPFALVVDDDGSCYLEPEEKLKSIGFIIVRRAEDGYHVTVRLEGVEWSAKTIPEERKSKLIPVATFTDAARARSGSPEDR